MEKGAFHSSLPPRNKSLPFVSGSSPKKLGVAHVNDAFGTAHFAHSSMVSATQGQNAVCVSGILIVAKEWNAFSQVIRDDVQRPLSAIVGGAKMSDKILVIENLIHVLSDAIVICLWRHGIYIHEGSNAMVWRLESHYTIQKELAELTRPVAQDA